MNVEVKKPTQEEIDSLGLTQWPIWEKEPSVFDWTYDQKEVCYFLEGRVDVALPDGQNVSMGKGDLVTFPQGFSCQWTVHEAVRKHYRFG